MRSFEGADAGELRGLQLGKGYPLPFFVSTLYHSGAVVLLDIAQHRDEVVEAMAPPGDPRTRSPAPRRGPPGSGKDLRPPRPGWESLNHLTHTLGMPRRNCSRRCEAG